MFMCFFNFRTVVFEYGMHVVRKVYTIPPISFTTQIIFIRDSGDVYPYASGLLTGTASVTRTILVGVIWYQYFLFYPLVPLLP